MTWWSIWLTAIETMSIITIVVCDVRRPHCTGGTNIRLKCLIISVLLFVHSLSVIAAVIE